MPTSGDRSQAQQHTPAVSVTAPVVGSSSAAQQQQQQQPQSWVPQTRQQQQQQPQQQQIQHESLLQQPVQPHQNQNQMWPGQPHVSSAGVATQPYYGANGVVSVPGYPAGQMGWTVNGMGYSLPYFPARVKKVKMKRNCEACTHAKVKCDGKRPCSRCKTRGVAKTCKFLPKKSRWDKSRDTELTTDDLLSEMAARTMNKSMTQQIPVYGQSSTPPSDLNYASGMNPYYASAYAAPSGGATIPAPMPIVNHPVQQGADRKRTRPSNEHPPSKPASTANSSHNLSARCIDTANLRAESIKCQSLQYETALQLSDPRFKENLSLLADCTGSLLKLSPVQFTWKASGRRAIGFLADEVQRHLPACVHEDAAGRKMINESALVAIVCQTLKSHDAQVSAVREQLAVFRKLAFGLLGLVAVAVLFGVYLYMSPGAIAGGATHEQCLDPAFESAPL